MSNLHQDQGKRNTVRGGDARRRLGAWLLLGWVMFWFTTAIAQPFCCINFTVGAGGKTAAAQQFNNHPVDHADDSSRDRPACPDLTLLDAISPTAAASAGDRLDLAIALPPADAIEPAGSGPVRLARYLSIPPPRHVPLYLRNQRFLI